MPVDLRELDQLLSTLEAFDTTFAEAPRQSIRRPLKQRGLSAAMEALRQGSKSSDALIFERVLGQGGMGTVRLAEQRSVGRDVAVKSLRANNTSDAHSTQALLSEGWVMGALEHPNIPPVHDVMLDEEGLPLILLKRIDGEAWSELISDEAMIAGRFGESILDWNLGVLDTVCNAVSYAHSKRIVHRDLKPENVMIGAFGEVYVLDWGIAAALDKEASSRLPYIGDGSQPAGTPCYMAPEALVERPTLVDERTDIYLLGAILCEILTGNPPHLYKSMKEIVRSISLSSPSFPNTAPAGLVTICQKAMHADPDQRYVSVEELQLALRRYQQRRASQLLSDKALQRLASLVALAKETPGDEGWTTMSALFSECRFAFRQALEAFPDDEVAREGLAAATEVMVRRALLDERLDAARTFVGELENVTQELLDEIASVAEKTRLKDKRFAALERQQNTELSKGKRIVVVAVFALFMTCGSLAGELFRGTYLFNYGTAFAWQFFLLVGFIWSFRKFALEETENNRLTYILIASVLASQLGATLAGYLAGLSLNGAYLIDSAIWFAAGVTSVFMMGWIYAGIPVAYFACMLTIAAFPEYAYYAIGAANVVLALNAGLVFIFEISPRSLVVPDARREVA